MSKTLKKFDYEDIEKAFSKLSFSLSDVRNLSPKDALVRAGLMESSEDLSNPPPALTRALMCGINRIATDWNSVHAWWALWALGQINPDQQGREMEVLSNMLKDRPWDDQILNVHARLGAVASDFDKLDELLKSLRPQRQPKDMSVYQKDEDENEDEDNFVLPSSRQPLTAAQHALISTACVRAAFAARVSPTLFDWKDISNETFAKGVAHYVKNCNAKTPKWLDAMAQYCKPSKLGDVETLDGGAEVAHAQMILYLASTTHNAGDQVVEYLKLCSKDLDHAVLAVADGVLETLHANPKEMMAKIDDGIYGIETVASPKKLIKLVEKFIDRIVSSPQLPQISSVLLLLLRQRPSHTSIIQKLASLATREDFQGAMNDLMENDNLQMMEKLYEVLPAHHNRQEMLLVATQNHLVPHKLLAADMQKIALTIALQSSEGPTSVTTPRKKM